MPRVPESLHARTCTYQAVENAKTPEQKACELLNEVKVLLASNKMEEAYQLLYNKMTNLYKSINDEAYEAMIQLRKACKENDKDQAQQLSAGLSMMLSPIKKQAI